MAPHGGLEVDLLLGHWTLSNGGIPGSLGVWVHGMPLWPLGHEPLEQWGQPRNEGDPHS